MITRNRSLALAALTSAALVLTACGGSDEPEDHPVETSAEADTSWTVPPLPSTDVFAEGSQSGSAPTTVPSPPTAPPALTTTPPPALPDTLAGANENDAESVMLAVARTLLSYAPGKDVNQSAAAQRAAPLLDERYYAANADSFIALAPITGKQWQNWADDHAIVIATASIAGDEHPADQPAKVSRVLAVTQTATGPDGKELSKNTFAVYMSAVKIGVWRVSAVAVR